MKPSRSPAVRIRFITAPRVAPQGNAETNLASATRDQIGHHAISSDHRKSQRQTSKDAKDSQRSVLNAQRVFHRVAERVNVSLQKLGMDVGEFSAHAGNKLARIPLRTDQEMGMKQELLPLQAEHHRFGGYIEPAVADILHHADHLDA